MERGDLAKPRLPRRIIEWSLKHGRATLKIHPHQPPVRQKFEHRHRDPDIGYAKIADYGAQLAEEARAVFIPLPAMPERHLRGLQIPDVVGDEVGEKAFR
jgi:hypothetical protein